MSHETRGALAWLGVTLLGAGLLALAVYLIALAVLEAFPS